MGAAGCVHRGDHDTVVWVNDAVVTSVGAATGLGFLMGPVFAVATPLFTPSIGMENLNDKHEVSWLLALSEGEEQREGIRSADQLWDRCDLWLIWSLLPPVGVCMCSQSRCVACSAQAEPGLIALWFRSGSAGRWHCRPRACAWRLRHRR